MVQSFKPMPHEAGMLLDRTQDACATAAYGFLKQTGCLPGNSIRTKNEYDYDGDSNERENDAGLETICSRKSSNCAETCSG
jgi:hypothetical protein